MTIPREINFQLVNLNDDYIEFTVSYGLGSNHLIASGIGWISEELPKYYLRLLKINRRPAPFSEYEGAKIGKIKSSYGFVDRKLKSVTEQGILTSLKLRPAMHKTDIDEGSGVRLIPRFSSRRQAH